MIEIIKEWTMTMCVTAVAGALAGMTAPKAGVGKIFKITLSTFFLCCMIMPFFSARDTISFDFSNSGTDYQVSDDEIDEMLREQTLFNAKNIIESDLNEYIEEKTDFSPLKIDVIMNTEDESEIYISEVTLTVSEQSYAGIKSIENDIKEDFQIDVLNIKTV